MITPTNEYFVRTSLYSDPAKDGNVQLRVGPRFAKGIRFIEVHFAELGGFPRLVQAMELTGSTWGFGIDEKRLGPLRFELRVLDPGDELEIGET